ncbi:MAG: type II toxin-antitoxin system ParD family antitoxin [Tepidisphaerales bacterium]
MSLNIQLPDELDGAVRLRAGFLTASQYVESLILADLERNLAAEIERELEEAEASGPATEMTSEDWSAIRDEVQRRYAARSRQ